MERSSDSHTVQEAEPRERERERERMIRLKKKNKNNIKKDRNEREKKPSYRAERKLDEFPPWEEVKIERERKRESGGGRITRMARRVDHRPG